MVEYLAYDAHGKRRLADWQPGTPNTLNRETPRGFTGHEHLDGVGLIHMNGRVYDPTLGRFLSADPFVQAPDSTQSFNRYTYANNNPLSYTDPSGFFIKKIFKGFKKIGKAIGEAIKAVVDEVVSVARSVLEIPLVQTVGQIAAGGFGGPWGAAAYAGLVTVANGGSIGDGLLAAGIALGTAQAFHAVGDAFGEVTFLSPEHFGKVVAHGTVGGVSSVARGGEFHHGFLAAGAAQFAAPGISRIYEGDYSQEAIAVRTTVAAAAGGAAAELGGGKFLNGAITGAFSRLYNDEAHARIRRQKSERVAVSIGYTDTPVGIGNHALVIGTDLNSGEQFATRAGPRMTAFGPVIYAQTGLYNEDFIDPPSAVHTLQKVGELSISVEEFARRAIDFAQITNANNVSYLGVTSNSNSYAFTFVESLGFSRPAPLVWAPGRGAGSPSERLSY